MEIDKIIELCREFDDNRNEIISETDDRLTIEFVKFTHNNYFAYRYVKDKESGETYCERFKLKDLEKLVIEYHKNGVSWEYLPSIEINEDTFCRNFEESDELERMKRSGIDIN